ncbi:MAG: peptidoglycan recognition family protein [Alphaproteobacteria bacterium]
MRFEIVPRYLTAPSKRRSGQALAPGVRFIVAHDTGNPGSTAANNVAYYEASRGEMSASAHLFVDDREILECIPALTGPPEKAWHVLYGVPVDNQLFGFDANNAAIGVEYCYGANINADLAYDRYVWVMAYICHRFALDPHRSIVGHFFLDPHRKTDPVTGLAFSRRTYEQLLRDVVVEYERCLGVPAPPAAPAAGRVRARTRLNIRGGAPSTRAPILRTVEAGTELAIASTVETGEPVNGNAVWYADGVGGFFWSGAVEPVTG